MATHEMRRSPKVGALAEGHPAHLAQLEQGQEAHDHLDAGAAALDQRAEGGGPLGLAGTAMSSDTASETERVSTVTWDRSTRGTGRSADPRR